MNGCTKIILLQTLYDVYEETAKDFRTACERDCSACCSHNVIATSLETDLALQFLADTGRESIIPSAAARSGPKRMRPRITINALAEYCLNRKDPPPEVSDYERAPCPFRTEEGCPLYPVRPFSCRAMWSVRRCSDSGEALMDPLPVTLNGVFQQLIEHVDVGGLQGNFLDLMCAFSDDAGLERYRSGAALAPQDGLPANRANPGFPVPPGHRGTVVEVLNNLWARRVDGLSFREAVDSIRVGYDA